MMEAASSTQARPESLWNHAAGWRNLTIAASFLTLAAVALPVLLPQPQDVTPQIAPAKHAAPATAESAPIAKPALAPAASVPRPAAPVHVAALVRHNPVRADVQPVATPDVTAAPVCALRQTAIAPVLVGVGTVVGFEDQALALANIDVSQAQAGGKIDPDYVQNQRAMVQRPNGQVRAFIVPRNMTVRVGDRVTLENGYRNMALPCNYVPIQIASDIGPAPPPTEAPP